MSRLPPTLARRVDRLARRAHRFHRWAHHPLCARYESDVIPLGRRTRVCRGCTFAAAGGAAGLALGLGLPPATGPWWLGAAALLLALTPAATPSRRPTTASAPAGAHPPKLLTRLLPMAIAGGALGQALTAPSPSRGGAAAIAGVAVAWALLRYRRRGPDRAACQGCPEGLPGARCPGFAPMVRREKALSRLAGSWIAHHVAATPPPPPTPPSRPRPS